MTDGIIKGSGNSRLIRSVPDIQTRYPTWDAAAAALAAGTFPIDLNGINELGWQVLATALNKANLLSDATAAILGLTSTATVNDALNNAFSTLVTTKNTANAAKSTADTANSNANSALNLATEASKIQIVTGAYTGDGAETRKITLSFTPMAVFILNSGVSGFAGGMAVTGRNSVSVHIVSSGFNVFNRNNIFTNNSGQNFAYIAFKF